MDVGASRYRFPRMARLARVVVPGLPHHATPARQRQRGDVFGKDDYA
jgi:hypothetical protein